MSMAALSSCLTAATGSMTLGLNSLEASLPRPSKLFATAMGHVCGEALRYPCSA